MGKYIMSIEATENSYSIQTNSSDVTVKVLLTKKEGGTVEHTSNTTLEIVCDENKRTIIVPPYTFEASEEKTIELGSCNFPYVYHNKDEDGTKPAKISASWNSEEEDVIDEESGSKIFGYIKVEPKEDESPSEEGWYEKNADGSFILSADIKVDETKTYYKKSEYDLKLHDIYVGEYSMSLIKTDTSIDPRKNTSSLKIQVMLTQEDGNPITHSGETEITVSCDGKSKTITNTGYSFDESTSKIELGYCIFDNIEHDTDGNKSVNLSVSWYSNEEEVAHTIVTEEGEEEVTSEFEIEEEYSLEKIDVQKPLTLTAGDNTSNPKPEGEEGTSYHVVGSNVTIDCSVSSGTFKGWYYSDGSGLYTNNKNYTISNFQDAMSLISIAAPSNYYSVSLKVVNGIISGGSQVFVVSSGTQITINDKNITIGSKTFNTIPKSLTDAEYSYSTSPTWNVTTGSKITSDIEIVATYTRELKKYNFTLKGCINGGEPEDTIKYSGLVNYTFLNPAKPEAVDPAPSGSNVEEINVEVYYGSTFIMSVFPVGNHGIVGAQINSSPAIFSDDTTFSGTIKDDTIVILNLNSYCEVTVCSNPDVDGIKNIKDSEIEYDIVIPEEGDNPKEKGWYEKDEDGNYILSTDVEVVETKTYYVRNNVSVFNKTVKWLYNSTHTLNVEFNSATEENEYVVDRWYEGKSKDKTKMKEIADSEGATSLDITIENLSYPYFYMVSSKIQERTYDVSTLYGTNIKEIGVVKDGKLVDSVSLTYQDFQDNPQTLKAKPFADSGTIGYSISGWWAIYKNDLNETVSEKEILDDSGSSITDNEIIITLNDYLYKYLNEDLGTLYFTSRAVEGERKLTLTTECGDYITSITRNPDSDNYKVGENVTLKAVVQEDDESNTFVFNHWEKWEEGKFDPLNPVKDAYGNVVDKPELIVSVIEPVYDEKGEICLTDNKYKAVARKASNSYILSIQADDFFNWLKVEGEECENKEYINSNITYGLTINDIEVEVKKGCIFDRWSDDDTTYSIEENVIKRDKITVTNDTNIIAYGKYIKPTLSLVKTPTRDEEGNVTFQVKVIKGSAEIPEEGGITVTYGEDNTEVKDVEITSKTLEEIIYTIHDTIIKYVKVDTKEGDNPSKEGWYEKNNEGVYFLSIDTTVLEGKVYYKKCSNDDETRSYLITINDEVDETINREKATLTVFVKASFKVFTIYDSTKGVVGAGAGVCATTGNFNFSNGFKFRARRKRKINFDKYVKITPKGTENPSEEEWYEKDSEGNYILSTDVKVDILKTYYSKVKEVEDIATKDFYTLLNEDFYVVDISNSTEMNILRNVSILKTNKYIVIDDPSGSPVEQGWYEKDLNDNYFLSEDTEVDESKTYYLKTIVSNWKAKLFSINNYRFLSFVGSLVLLSDSEGVDIIDLSEIDSSINYPSDLPVNMTYEKPVDDTKRVDGKTKIVEDTQCGCVSGNTIKLKAAVGTLSQNTVIDVNIWLPIDNWNIDAPNTTQYQPDKDVDTTYRTIPLNLYDSANVYVVTPKGIEVPSEEGWYELNSKGNYVLTSDKKVDTEKEYFAISQTDDDRKIGIGIGANPKCEKYENNEKIKNLLSFGSGISMSVSVDAGGNVEKNAFELIDNQMENVKDSIIITDCISKKYDEEKEEYVADLDNLNCYLYTLNGYKFLRCYGYITLDLSSNTNNYIDFFNLTNLPEIANINIHFSTCVDNISFTKESTYFNHIAYLYNEYKNETKTEVIRCLVEPKTRVVTIEKGKETYVVNYETAYKLETGDRIFFNTWLPLDSY